MNDMLIKLPKYFNHLKPETQNDEIFPDHASLYAYRTEDTSAIVIAGRVERQHVMPFDDIEAIKNSLASHLKEDEGLIKADSGITGNGERYIYYIKKHVETDGILNNRTAYISKMNIELDNNVWLVESCFYEIGEIGLKKHLVKKVFNTWYEDPRELIFEKGIPMDISEQEHYDDIFPEHSLSELRRFLKYLVENN